MRPDLPTIFRSLTERLRSAGYTEPFLRERLGVAHADDVGLLNRAPALERMADDRSPAAVLARLFYLEAPERRTDVRRALPELDALRRSGLLAVRGSRVRARLRIDAIDDLYVAADRRFESPDPSALALPRGDMVYPVGADSAVLMRLAQIAGGAAALDLCTGSGVQALAAARGASSVIAVDVSARAVAMTRTNASLNGVADIDARRGDLYRPVAGERFDVVIANPPFVPAPRRGPSYHSGGPFGDRVLSRVVVGADEHLSAGGRLFAVSHLALRTGESVGDRVRPWLQGFAGRALALLLETGSTVDLAAAQALFALDRGFASYAAEVRRWVSYLGRRGIVSIVFVAIALEKRGRPGLDVVEGFQRVLPLPLSKSPEAMVADWLQAG